MKHAPDIYPVYTLTSPYKVSSCQAIKMSIPAHTFHSL